MLDTATTTATTTVTGTGTGNGTATPTATAIYWCYYCYSYYYYCYLSVLLLLAALRCTELVEWLEWPVMKSLVRSQALHAFGLVVAAGAAPWTMGLLDALCIALSRLPSFPTLTSLCSAFYSTGLPRMLGVTTSAPVNLNALLEKAEEIDRSVPDMKGRLVAWCLAVQGEAAAPLSSLPNCVYFTFGLREALKSSSRAAIMSRQSSIVFNELARPNKHETIPKRTLQSTHQTAACVCVYACTRTRTHHATTYDGLCYAARNVRRSSGPFSTGLTLRRGLSPCSHPTQKVGSALGCSS